MNFNNLMNFIDAYSTKNNNTFKDIHSLLYFSDEKTIDTKYIQSEIIKKNIFHIKQNNIKKNLITIPTELPFNLENLEVSKNEYQLLSKAIFACIGYTDNLDIFYDKLLKEYDSENLFKKFDLYHKIKKDTLRHLIIDRNDEEEYMIKLLIYYLKINLVIIKNQKQYFYCPEEKFISFRPTIILLKTDNMYCYLENNNSGLLLRDDNLINIESYFNMKYDLSKSIEKVKSVKKSSITKPIGKLSNYKKMKIAELRTISEEYGIKLTYEKSGKDKNKTKKMLLEELEKLL